MKRKATFNDTLEFGMRTIDNFALRAGWDAEYVKDQKFKLVMEALRHMRRIDAGRKGLIYVSRGT